MRRGKHETNSTFLHHYYSGTDVRTVLQGVSKRLPQTRKGGNVWTLPLPPVLGISWLTLRG